MSALGFLREFVMNPAHTGAVAPSSARLAQRMVEEAGVATARVVVEFGPGTGAFTEAILPRLREDACFIAMELNGVFVETLRRRFPGVRVIHDSAANTGRHLQEAGHNKCDCIVSGLPWASFDSALQDELLGAVADVLEPGGRFVTFTYIHSPWLAAGKAFRKKLDSRFASVTTSPVVWRNMPPAFVYRAVH